MYTPVNPSCTKCGVRGSSLHGLVFVMSWPLRYLNLHIHKKNSTETDTKTSNRTNNNRTTALERSVINYWVGLKSRLRALPHPQFLKWFQTLSWLFGSRACPFKTNKTIHKKEGNYLDFCGYRRFISVPVENVKRKMILQFFNFYIGCRIRDFDKSYYVQITPCLQ